MKTSPQEKRAAAIQEMHNDIAPKGIVDPTCTVEDMLVRILSLKKYSISPRWQNAIDDYASLIQDNPDRLNWAYIQGSVFFSYAIIGLI